MTFFFHHKLRIHPDFVKLNTNASVSNGKASRAGLLRDHEERLIFAFYKEFGEVDVLTAESLALLHGLQLCKNARTLGLLVEVDLGSLVRMINAGMLCNSSHRIRDLLQHLRSTVSHTFREVNSAVDKLASMMDQDDFVGTTIYQLPRVVKAAIVLDSRELSSVRLQVVRE